MLPKKEKTKENQTNFSKTMNYPKFVVGKLIEMMKKTLDRKFVQQIEQHL